MVPCNTGRYQPPGHTKEELAFLRTTDSQKISNLAKSHFQSKEEAEKKILDTFPQLSKPEYCHIKADILSSALGFSKLK